MSRPLYSDAKTAKMCRNSSSSSSFSNSSSSHFLFPRDFSGTIEDTDIINTPLEPLDPKMCLLGVSLILLPILGVKLPQNPNFGGVNRRFQAKRAKCWKFHVIETTLSILTKSSVTIETTKWSSRLVPVGAQQIQDGGRPPFWKKTVKSPYICDRSTDVDEI